MPNINIYILQKRASKMIDINKLCNCSAKRWRFLYNAMKCATFSFNVKHGPNKQHQFNIGDEQVPICKNLVKTAIEICKLKMCSKCKF